ncbi:TonB family protein [Chromatiaceae bacterium AAb-1]|nr:TonB family protein [Chromatiaceae bacterium AAb-1]
MRQHLAQLWAGPLCWQVLSLLVVLLAHAVAIEVAFSSVAPAPETVSPPQLQGVLVQKVVVQEQLPQEVVTEPPPPEPPKPVKKTPPKEKRKPQPEVAAVKQEPAPVFQVAQHEETDTEPPPPAETAEPPPPVQHKPVAAPVRMPDAHAAHLQNPAPVYPTLSRKLREQGTVILHLLVQADGKVGDIRIYESSGYARLDESALQAVKRWRYTPAVQHGQPVDYWHLQPVVFSLN